MHPITCTSWIPIILSFVSSLLVLTSFRWLRELTKHHLHSVLVQVLLLFQPLVIVSRPYKVWQSTMWELYTSLTTASIRLLVLAILPLRCNQPCNLQVKKALPPFSFHVKPFLTFITFFRSLSLSLFRQRTTITTTYQTAYRTADNAAHR